jgi:ribonuclease HI
MKSVELVPDGSCVRNPGPGGWACILRYREQERELTGSHPQSTNNRMELTAAIEGLRALKERCVVILVTDSQYLKQGVTQFLARWKATGWLTANRKPVLNQDLWQQLDELVTQHEIRWAWVAGDGDHAVQNRADALARTVAREEASRAGVEC